MSKLFSAIALIYVLVVLAAGVTALWTTLWAYNLDHRMISDTVTAAIINTAAVAVVGLFGGFDMLFSIWQFMRNQEAEKVRQSEREEERKARDAERAEERKAQQAEREAMLATMRAEREQFMAQIQAERERSDALTARVLELSKIAIQRANGNATNGNTDKE